MRKFIYHPGKGLPTIYECELTLVQPRPWECKNDEQLYIVEAPEQFKGERWYSQFLQDTVDQAQQHAKNMIAIDVDNVARKKKVTFSDEELLERFKVRVEML